jgi:hypothetical protein
VVCGAIDGFAGVMAIDTRVAFTCKVTEPLMPPEVAVIVVEPLATADIMPPPAMVAIFVADELQVAELVRSFELPSLYDPIAVNCSELFVSTDKLGAVTEMLLSFGVPPPPPPPLLLVPPQAERTTMKISGINRKHFVINASLIESKSAYFKRMAPSAQS